MRTNKALSYLRIVRGKQVSPCGLITFGDGARGRAESYAQRNRGQVFSAKAAYTIMNPNYIANLGPGYIVSKRLPNTIW